MKLNKAQLQRCYQVFDFEEYEELVNGEINDNNEMVLNYVDNIDGIIGHYKPTLEQEQLDFIMNGIKLERDEK